MAKVIDEQELIHKAEHAEIFEKRYRRCLSLINKCHKISLWHKIKDKFSKCSICKELEGLK